MNNFMQYILGTDRNFKEQRIEREVLTEEVVEPTIGQNKEIIPEKFRKDISILESKYGELFISGLCINLTLQETLDLLPRQRPRVSAYDSLTKYLKGTREITLTIKSNKSK